MYSRYIRVEEWHVNILIGLEVGGKALKLQESRRPKENAKNALSVLNY